MIDQINARLPPRPLAEEPCFRRPPPMMGRPSGKTMVVETAEFPCVKSRACWVFQMRIKKLSAAALCEVRVIVCSGQGLDARLAEVSKADSICRKQWPHLPRDRRMHRPSLVECGNAFFRESGTATGPCRRQLAANPFTQSGGTLPALVAASSVTFDLW